MASLDKSTLVLELSCDDNMARQNLLDSHNEQFGVHDDTSQSDAEDQAQNLREGTPLVHFTSIHCYLRTTNKLKNPNRGWTFGSNRDRCDFFLGPGVGWGISGIHFAINHNWQSNCLRVQNLYSTNGTIIESKNLGKQRLHGNQMVALINAEGTTLKAGHLAVTLRIPLRGAQQAAYDRNLDSFKYKVLEAHPAIDTLNVQASVSETPVVPSDDHPYVLEKQIGRGAFATVYRAFQFQTGDLFAAKKFIITGRGEEPINRRASIKEEIKCLQSLSHNHIIKYIDSYYEGSSPILVMEYAKFGNLADYSNPQVGAGDGECIALDDVRRVMEQVLRALQYLHDERAIIHRDVKPENILFVSRTPLHVKLSDFGLSTNKSHMATMCGTIDYLAPEIQKPMFGSISTGYSSAVDIWSLGIVIHEYTYGMRPQTLPVNARYAEINRRAYHALICATADRGLLAKYVVQMLKVDPGQRQSARELLEALSSESSESLVEDFVLFRNGAERESRYTKDLSTIIINNNAIPSNLGEDEVSESGDLSGKPEAPTRQQVADNSELASIDSKSTRKRIINSGDTAPDSKVKRVRAAVKATTSGVQRQSKVSKAH